MERFAGVAGSQVFRYEGDVLLANRDFSVCTLLPLRDPYNFLVFSDHVFYSHAVRRQMVQLHCATIEDQGRGVLFLGPSGIGKTTQAERWAEFRGASIINGDVGFVQRTEREYIAWGTPLAWVVSLLPECFGARKGPGGAEAGPGKQAAGADWL